MNTFRFSLLITLSMIYSATLLADTPYHHKDAKGWSFYEPKKKIKKKKKSLKKTTEKQAEEYKKPVLPPLEVLYNMHPKEHEKLQKEFLNWAVKTQKVEDVKNYWIVLDTIRKKASGFSAVTKLVMDSNPDLNVNKQYPITRLGSEKLFAVRQNETNKFLSQNSKSFGLIYFTSESCLFCKEQDAILTSVVHDYGLRVKEVDVKKDRITAAKFGVNFTPTIAVVDRVTKKHMIISSGVESQPRIKESIISALRLLRGDIKPNQYFTNDFERGGSFDPAFQAPFISNTEKN